MNIARHRMLADEDLQPTWVPVGEDAAVRSRHMRELRRLSNLAPLAIRERDELLQALATSQTLSRRDMATASGLTEGRVQQIITELSERDQAIRDAAATERLARHRLP